MAVPPGMAAAAGTAASRLATTLAAGRGSLAGIEALRAAIIAWWACEVGWTWPPPRNNPGNIRPGLETPRASGVDSRNFLVFPTPEAGVDAFVDLILRGAPYAGIRSAIASVLSGSDPGLIASAVGASPWGTSGSCVRGALPIARAASTSATALAAQPVSSTPAQIRVTKVFGSPIQLASACAGTTPVPPPTGFGPFGLIPGGDQVYPLPPNRLSDPCACPTGYNRAQVDARIEGLFGTNYVPLSQLGPDQANACARSDVKEGSVFGQNLEKAAGDVAGSVGEAVAAAVGALEPVLVTVVMLVGIILLIVSGLYLVATSGAKAMA